MNKHLAIVAILFLVGSAADGREWSNKKGDQTVEADFVDINDGRVVVRLTDGSTVALPWDILHANDHEFVRKELARRREEIRSKVKTAPGTVLYGKGRKLAEIAAPAVNESSGMAVSRNHAGLFWTHNDSGDYARLYAFDRDGKDLGMCEIDEAEAYDFEDMTSFCQNGKSYLLVGDTGNNGLSAGVQLLHLVEEPKVDPEKGVAVKRVPQVQTIYYGYEDDHRNCEGFAVDPSSSTILFASKERTEVVSRIYSLKLPEKNGKKVHSAKKIATVKIPPATGMDISPDGLRMVICTYGNAYEFTRGKDEDWAAALKRLPAEIILPERRQGESITYGSDGKTLYLTSEKRPTPLWEIPVSSGK